MLKRKGLWRIIGPAMIVILGVVAAPSAANADTGGGCRNNSAGSASACISRNGNSVYADFYINWGYTSFCHAHLEIYIHGNMVEDRWYSPSYDGRYGPISQWVDSFPDQYQKAYSGVSFYDCNWGWKGSAQSPNLEYVR
ncbi:MAG TPA: hypothetical protein DGG94_02115 [Micromonosporaceae bacterium]|nr:hypothetical protein [Micromonosporaceae bacterium]HCU48619.1 hypothetical protein [Micromonosporaceae bacterium]